MVRYFQKTFRRAGIDVTYSEGFSPHQKIYFASPLGLGMTSVGEYIDIEMNSSKSSDIMLEEINDKSADGIKLLSFKVLPEGTKKSMATLAACDYKVYTNLFDENLLKEFLEQDEILVVKKTKKSEKTVDIKPMIFELEKQDDGIFMKVAQGSNGNLKPDLCLKAMCDFANIEPETWDIQRIEMYNHEGDELISMDEIGSNIE